MMILAYIFVVFCVYMVIGSFYMGIKKEKVDIALKELGIHALDDRRAVIIIMALLWPLIIVGSVLKRIYNFGARFGGKK